MGFFTKTLGFIGYIFLAKKLGPNSYSNQFLFLKEEILKIHFKPGEKTIKTTPKCPKASPNHLFVQAHGKNPVWGRHESWKGIGENPTELESALGFKTKILR